ncbi:MAG: DUF4097 family beta strand repeat-containing protein [Cyclobacteriaceae bacterium]
MKPIAFFAALTFICLSLVLTVEAFSQDQEPYLVKNFSVNAPAILEVKTSGGSISVERGNSDEVEVRMFVKKNGIRWFSSDDDIAEELEEYEIDIRQEGNTVMAIARRENRGWSSNPLSISFAVSTPTQTSAKLNTSGGSIRMKGLEGEHDVRTSGGSLNFDDITGYTQARTSGGSINVDHYAGVLDARTSGGSITARSSEGEIALHTSGGSIRLDEVSGSIDAHTSGGSIRANVKELGEYLTLRTSGGSVSAVIPKNQGLDLDLSGNRVNTRLENFSGESEKNHIEGSMNGGGVAVTMKTSGGSVTLDYHNR